MQATDIRQYLYCNLLEVEKRVLETKCVVTRTDTLMVIFLG